MSMPAGGALVIKRKSDLAALSRAVGMLGIRRAGKLVLALDGPKRSRQLAWERRLNAYLGRCGCTAGAVVMLVSLAVGISFVVRYAGEAPPLELGLWVAAAAAGASLLGLAAKLAVLTITGVQIRAALKGILRAI